MKGALKFSAKVSLLSAHEVQSKSRRSANGPALRLFLTRFTALLFQLRTSRKHSTGSSRLCSSAAASNSTWGTGDAFWHRFTVSYSSSAIERCINCLGPSLPGFPHGLHKVSGRSNAWSRYCRSRSFASSQKEQQDMVDKINTEVSHPTSLIMRVCPTIFSREMRSRTVPRCFAWRTVTCFRALHAMTKLCIRRSKAAELHTKRELTEQDERRRSRGAEQQR